MENPAFLTETDATLSSSGPASSTTGGGMGSTADPTQPAPTTTLEPTSGTSVGSSTTTAAASSSDTLPDQTTDPVDTTGVPPDTTSGTTAADTGGSSSGDVMMCEQAIAMHDIKPFAPVYVLGGGSQLTNEQCALLALNPNFDAQLWIYPTGFSLKPNCGGNKLQWGIEFKTGWLDLDYATIAGNSTCVQATVKLHPYLNGCYASLVSAFSNGKLTLAGAFGKPEANMQVPGIPNFFVSRTPGCPCVDCCPGFMDSDQYKFIIGGEGVLQGHTMPVTPPNDSGFHFMNFRSDVHAPECTNMNVNPADWQHFDWMLARLK